MEHIDNAVQAGHVLNKHRPFDVGVKIALLAAASAKSDAELNESAQLFFTTTFCLSFVSLCAQFFYSLATYISVLALASNGSSNP